MNEEGMGAESQYSLSFRTVDVMWGAASGVCSYGGTELTLPIVCLSHGDQWCISHHPYPAVYQWAMI